MKNISIIIVTLFLSLSLTGQDQYTAGMGKAFQLWGEGKGMEAIAMFERISQAESDNWLPPYYVANVLIVESFMTKDQAKVNEMLEKASGYIKEAHERSPDNSEIVTMEGLLYTGYVAMDPATYGMMYSPKIMGLHTKAIELDSLNPRAHANAIEYEMGSAKFFGTDLKTFCERLEALKPLFENQKSEVPFSPSYGIERVEENMKECGC